MIDIQIKTSATNYPQYFERDLLQKYLDGFFNIIAREDNGFYQLTEDSSHLDQAKNIFEKFKHKKIFVQVGIGGSALGPQMLIDALQSNKNQFLFFDNIDSEKVARDLDSIEDHNHALFYIVSKSGGTAETISCFMIIQSWLRDRGIEEKDFSKYFVFCTDPVKGDLRALSDKLSISTLEVPDNVGGRFSVLSAVGLLPALFAGVDIDKLYQGANQVKEILEDKDVSRNQLVQVAATLNCHLKENQISQTVFMPYSSTLKTMSAWFIQLWSESLGKTNEKNPNGVGLTPIPAYGATDQHSQMQLFMQGANDKVLFLLNVKNRSTDFVLSSSIKSGAFAKLNGYSLNQLMQAEFNGTLKALNEAKRELIVLEIERNNEESLGALIMLSESLTVMMSQFLDVDPFDQPGVEKGKIYAYEYLDTMSKV